MGTSENKNRFFSFNIGHLITIAIYIISVAVYGGIIKATLLEHGKSINKTETELMTLKERYYELISSGGAVDKSQNLNLQALDIRVSRVETSLSKIDVLVNDFNWLKQWTLKQDEKK